MISNVIYKISDLMNFDFTFTVYTLLFGLKTMTGFGCSVVSVILRSCVTFTQRKLNQFNYTHHHFPLFGINRTLKKIFFALMFDLMTMRLKHLFFRFLIGNEPDGTLLFEIVQSWGRESYRITRFTKQIRFEKKFVLILLVDFVLQLARY